MNIWLKRHILAKKAVSAAILITFSIGLIPADAQGHARGTPARRTESSAHFDADTFSLPPHLGEVKYRLGGSSDKFIIHIQDAHCNYFAQRRIAELIGYLTGQYGIRVINLEGGSGDYNLSVFTDIADENTRREVSDHFLREGRINAAEFYAINNPGMVKLWGAEDKDLYLQNLKVYRDSLAYTEEAERYLKELTHILNNLKRHIYTPQLLNIDVAYNSYKAGNMEFRGYLKFLLERAKENNVRLVRFVNLLLLARVMEQEKKIDFKKANIERNLLIEKLGERISRNEKMELVEITVDFKTKRVSHEEFYGYLLGKARELELDTRHFPALSDYIAYVSAYEAVDHSRVMEEMDGLEAGIKERLYRNDTQRRLDALSRNLAIMKNIFAFTLINSDYDHYLNNKNAFEISRYLEFIRKKSPRYKIDAALSSGILELDDYMENILEFYEYSFKRDGAFLRNVKFSDPNQPITHHPSPITILITGGFHTENLRDLFRKEGIQYVSILPEFVNEEGYESPYFNLLAGRYVGIRKMLGEIIAQVSMLAIASMLSPVLTGDAYGRNWEYVLRAEVYVRQLVAEGKRVELWDDITEHADGEIPGNVTFGGETGSLIDISVSELLQGIGYPGAVDAGITDNIAGDEVTEEEKALWLEEAEKRSDEVRRLNRDIIETVKRRCRELLEEVLRRERDMRDTFRKLNVPEEWFKTVTGSLRDSGGAFRWSGAWVKGVKKYILGDKNVLAVDITRHLIEQEDITGVYNLLDEYIFHEVLEKTDLAHEMIITLTASFFGRGALNPLGEALKGFIRRGSHPTKGENGAPEKPAEMEFEKFLDDVETYLKMDLEYLMKLLDPENANRFEEKLWERPHEEARKYVEELSVQQERTIEDVEEWAKIEGWKIHPLLGVYSPDGEIFIDNGTKISIALECLLFQKYRLEPGKTYLKFTRYKKNSEEVFTGIYLKVDERGVVDRDEEAWVEGRERKGLRFERGIWVEREKTRETEEGIERYKEEEFLTFDELWGIGRIERVSGPDLKEAEVLDVLHDGTVLREMAEEAAAFSAAEATDAAEPEKLPEVPVLDEFLIYEITEILARDKEAGDKDLNELSKRVRDITGKSVDLEFHRHEDEFDSEEEYEEALKGHYETMQLVLINTLLEHFKVSEGSPVILPDSKRRDLVYTGVDPAEKAILMQSVKDIDFTPEEGAQYSIGMHETRPGVKRIWVRTPDGIGYLRKTVSRKGEVSEEGSEAEIGEEALSPDGYVPYDRGIKFREAEVGRDRVIIGDKAIDEAALPPIEVIGEGLPIGALLRMQAERADQEYLDRLENPAEGAALKWKAVDTMSLTILEEDTILNIITVPKTIVRKGNVYELDFTERIGEGGLGCVFKANLVSAGTEEMDEEIVVKILMPLPGEADLIAKAFFLREHWIMWKLWGIRGSVKSLGMGSYKGVQDIDREREYLFMAQEFVKGASLLDLVIKRFYERREGKRKSLFKLKELTFVARELLRIMGSAHKKGTIHRDLKPGNVMVKLDEKEEIMGINVIDWGTALHDPALPRQPRFTGARFIGTPRFASDSALLDKIYDKQSDLFAIGCILLMMIRGNLPWDIPDNEKLFRERVMTRGGVIKKIERDDRDMHPLYPLIIDLLTGKWKSADIAAIRKEYGLDRMGLAREEEVDLEDIVAKETTYVEPIEEISIIELSVGEAIRFLPGAIETLVKLSPEARAAAEDVLERMDTWEDYLQEKVIFLILLHAFASDSPELKEWTTEIIRSDQSLAQMGLELTPEMVMYYFHLRGEKPEFFEQMRARVAGTCGSELEGGFTMAFEGVETEMADMRRGLARRGARWKVEGYAGAVDTGITDGITGDEVTEEEKALWLEEAEKRSNEVKKLNRDIIETVQKKCRELLRKMLQREEGMRDAFRKFKVPEEWFETVTGSLRDLGGAFRWSEAWVKADKKYILGDKNVLAVDVIRYLIKREDEPEVYDLLDEYIFHEVLEKTDLSHKMIITLTNWFFGRGTFNPLGEALRRFIRRRNYMPRALKAHRYIYYRASVDRVLNKIILKSGGVIDPAGISGAAFQMVHPSVSGEKTGEDDIALEFDSWALIDSGVRLIGYGEEEVQTNDKVPLMFLTERSRRELVMKMFRRAPMDELKSKRKMIASALGLDQWEKLIAGVFHELKNDFMIAVQGKDINAAKYWLDVLNSVPEEELSMLQKDAIEECKASLASIEGLAEREFRKLLDDIRIYLKMDLRRLTGLLDAEGVKRFEKGLSEYPHRVAREYLEELSEQQQRTIEYLEAWAKIKGWETHLELGVYSPDGEVFIDKEAERSIALECLLFQGYGLEPGKTHIRFTPYEKTGEEVFIGTYLGIGERKVIDEEKGIWVEGREMNGLWFEKGIRVLVESARKTKKGEVKGKTKVLPFNKIRGFKRIEKVSSFDMKEAEVLDVLHVGGTGAIGKGSAFDERDSVVRKFLKIEYLEAVNQAIGVIYQRVEEAPLTDEERAIVRDVIGRLKEYALLDLIFVFDAVVKSEEDYLFAFPSEKTGIAIAREFLEPAYDFSADELAEVLYHEGHAAVFGEKDYEDHRRIYEGIPRKIFGENTLEAKIRALIEEKVIIDHAVENFIKGELDPYINILIDSGIRLNQDDIRQTVSAVIKEDLSILKRIRALVRLLTYIERASRDNPEIKVKRDKFHKLLFALTAEDQKIFSEDRVLTDIETQRMLEGLVSLTPDGLKMMSSPIGDLEHYRDAVLAVLEMEDYLHLLDASDIKVSHQAVMDLFISSMLKDLGTAQKACDLLECLSRIEDLLFEGMINKTERDKTLRLIGASSESDYTILEKSLTGFEVTKVLGNLANFQLGNLHYILDKSQKETDYSNVRGLIYTVFASRLPLEDLDDAKARLVGLTIDGLERKVEDAQLEEGLKREAERVLARLRQAFKEEKFRIFELIVDGPEFYLSNFKGKNGEIALASDYYDRESPLNKHIGEALFLQTFFIMRGLPLGEEGRTVYRGLKDALFGEERRHTAELKEIVKERAKTTYATNLFLHGELLEYIDTLSRSGINLNKEDIFRSLADSINGDYKLLETLKKLVGYLQKMEEAFLEDQDNTEQALRRFRVYKLVYAAIMNDSKVIGQRGLLKDWQFFNMLEGLAEFKPGNMALMIEESGRGEDYYDIRLGLEIEFGITSDTGGISFDMESFMNSECPMLVEAFRKSGVEMDPEITAEMLSDSIGEDPEKLEKVKSLAIYLAFMELYYIEKGDKDAHSKIRRDRTHKLIYAMETQNPSILFERGSLTGHQHVEMIQLLGQFNMELIDDFIEEAVKDMEGTTRAKEERRTAYMKIKDRLLREITGYSGEPEDTPAEDTGDGTPENAKGPMLGKGGRFARLMNTVPDDKNVFLYFGCAANYNRSPAMEMILKYLMKQAGITSCRVESFGVYDELPIIKEGRSNPELKKAIADMFSLPENDPILDVRAKYWSTERIEKSHIILMASKDQTRKLISDVKDKLGIDISARVMVFGELISELTEEGRDKLQQFIEYNEINVIMDLLWERIPDSQRGAFGPEITDEKLVLLLGEMTARVIIPLLKRREEMIRKKAEAREILKKELRHSGISSAPANALLKRLAREGRKVTLTRINDNGEEEDVISAGRGTDLRINIREFLYQAHEEGYDEHIARGSFVRMDDSATQPIINEVIHIMDLPDQVILIEGIIDLLGINAKNEATGEPIAIQFSTAMPEGLTEHAGGRGVTIREGLAGVELKRAVIHGILAGVLGDHVAVRDITTLMVDEGDIHKAKMLFQGARDRIYRKPLWHMSKQERQEAVLNIGRDYADGENSIEYSEFLNHLEKLISEKKSAAEIQADLQREFGLVPGETLLRLWNKDGWELVGRYLGVAGEITKEIPREIPGELPREPAGMGGIVIKTMLALTPVSLDRGKGPEEVKKDREDFDINRLWGLVKIQAQIKPPGEIPQIKTLHDAEKAVREKPAAGIRDDTKDLISEEDFMADLGRYMKDRFSKITEKMDEMQAKALKIVEEPLLELRSERIDAIMALTEAEVGGLTEEKRREILTDPEVISMIQEPQVSDEPFDEERADYRVFPRRIGNYHLEGEEWYGMGVSSKVFEAVDTGTNEKRAIKIFRAKEWEVISELREYYLMKEFDEVEGVIKVFEMGKYKSGKDEYYYLVMDFVEMTLEDWIKSGYKFTRKEILAIITQVIDILREMHKRGVIHGDISPGNIFFLRDTKTGDIKLIRIGDLGISVRRKDLRFELEKDKMKGRVRGQVDYLNFEARYLWRHSAKTDLFAMGRMFYNMISEKEFAPEEAAFVRTESALERRYDLEPGRLTTRFDKGKLRAEFDKQKKEIQNIIKENPVDPLYGFLASLMMENIEIDENDKVKPSDNEGIESAGEAFTRILDIVRDEKYREVNVEYLEELPDRISKIIEINPEKAASLQRLRNKIDSDENSEVLKKLLFSLMFSAAVRESEMKGSMSGAYIFWAESTLEEMKLELTPEMLALFVAYMKEGQDIARVADEAKGRINRQELRGVALGIFKKLREKIQKPLFNASLKQLTELLNDWWLSEKGQNGGPGFGSFAKYPGTVVSIGDMEHLRNRVEEIRMQGNIIKLGMRDDVIQMANTLLEKMAAMPEAEGRIDEEAVIKDVEIVIDDLGGMVGATSYMDGNKLVIVINGSDGKAEDYFDDKLALAWLIREEYLEAGWSLLMEHGDIKRLEMIENGYNALTPLARMHIRHMTLEQLENITPDHEFDPSGVFYAASQVEIQGRRGRGVLENARMDPCAFLLPLTEKQRLEHSKDLESYLRKTEREIKKKYGIHIRAYYYDPADKDSLKKAGDRAMGSSIFRNRNARLLAYIPDYMNEGIVDSFMKDMKENPQFAGIVKEDINEDEILDEVLHVVLGVGLIDYSKTGRREVADSIRKLLSAMVEDPAVVENMDLNKLLKGAISLKIKKIDYSKIRELKEAWDAILISL